MQNPVADARQPLPPLASVAAALRTVTEHLAGELVNPQPAAPDWSEFEWRTARAVAAMHGVSGLLAGALLWRGAEGLAEFLSRQREHIARRQMLIDELLVTVDERFGRCGIPVQALKGAALCREGFYQAGQRPMADLDLLTSSQHLARAGEILECLGLREAHRTFKHRVFESSEGAQARSFGEHADNGIKVELHERICEQLPYRLTDISHLVWPRDAVAGLNPYPSRAALMAHLLLHAGNAMAYRMLRMVQLHDIALLARHLTPPDWHQLLEWRPWWAWPVLSLAERYYGTSGPQAVMTALRTSCPIILRHRCARQSLSDVSLSSLWLEAFPGIEWAHSLGEAATFIARRIVPSAEVRADRKFALSSDPALAHGDWGGLPQRRRILRAVRARTPRPWPLHNVREALARSHAEDAVHTLHPS
jgi:hypothetical protein